MAHPVDIEIHPESIGDKRVLPRKREDTAAGCRLMAADDHARADADGNDRMRFQLEQSAGAWTKRADLLARLEKKFDDRMAAAASAQVATNDQI